MRKRIVLIVIGLSFFGALLSTPVLAHVLVTDQQNKGSAILHIMPDDNPVLGEQTTIYFDTQKNLLTEKSSVQLSIKQVGQAATKVPATIEGSLITAQYTFKNPAVYTFTYKIAGNTHHTFTYSIRVSKGGMQQIRYPWAEGLLFTCGAAALLLIILAWNNRKAIKNVSKM